MESKTSKAIGYYKAGKIKEAFRIFKTFKAGFSLEEKRIIGIASDCLNGRSSFYNQLGVDVENTILSSKSIIQSKYSL